MLKNLSVQLAYVVVAFAYVMLRVLLLLLLLLLYYYYY